LFIAAICNALTGFAIAFGNLWLLIGSRFMAGLMEGNIAIARAMAADLTSISKHEGFGKINAAASIAFLVGPLIGGLMTDKTLFEEFTTSTPFYLICLLFFCLAGLSMLVLQNGNAVPEKSARSFLERINIIQRMKKLFQNKRLRFLMLTSTCFTLAVDIFYEFGPVYLTVKWTLDPAVLVIYNALLCLALAVGNGWLPGFIFQKVSSKRAILYSLGGFALFLAGMLVSDVPHLMMFLYIFSGLVIGLGVTLLTVKISNSVSETIQGEVMGVQLSLRVLGDAVICLLGGALLLISSKVILMVAATLSLIAMGYYKLNDS
jgi:MFS family permease